jgi:hypothetical protein
MGRSEDLAFSPEQRRLAITEFARNRILVIELAKEARLLDGAMELTRSVEISSSQIRSPHGVCFLDEETIAVANRDSGTRLFRVPANAPDGALIRSSALRRIGGGWLRPKVNPGSVTVSRLRPDLVELLICNNYQNTVSRHYLDRHQDHRIRASQVLLNRGLAVPDGVAVSRDSRWIAISNHGTHSVLIFENRDDTAPWTEPVGELLDVECPHGLAFTDDGRTLLVASAATPFVLVFAADRAPEVDWQGRRQPVASIRVMDDETFLKGQTNPEEGGPKGLKVSSELNLLALTSEFQPLAFFDLAPLLQDAGLSPLSRTG